MGIVVTFQDFLNRANLKHNNFYDYSKVNFTILNNKYTIICPIHGSFEQSGAGHLNGRGCPICRYIKSGKSNRKTKEKFLEEVKEKGLLEEFEYLSDYTTAKTKIKIQHKICGHIFEQAPGNHLNGNGCPKCAGKVNYIELFKEKATKIHNGKYDYSLVIKVHSKVKIPILCSKHGVFWQTPSGHIHGYGCKKCAVELDVETKKVNHIGWRYNNWIEAAKKSKKFDSFKVYILECWDENERFFKIGKTFTTIKYRFKSCHIPYQWKLLKTFEGEGRFISDLENELKRKNKQFEYLPNKKFGGWLECFSKVVI